MILKRTYSDIDVRNFIDMFSLEVRNGLDVTYRKESLKHIKEDREFTDALKTECGIYYFIQ